MKILPMTQRKPQTPVTVTREQFDRISAIGGVLPKGYVIAEDVQEDLKLA